MLAFVSGAHLSDRHVKSYYTKGYFDKFLPVHKGTALSKQQPTTGTKRAGQVRSLTSTPGKLGSCSNLCYRDFANVTLKTRAHE